MKFTDGFWHLRPGVNGYYAREVDRITADDASIRAIAPTKVVETRGDVLNQPTITASVDAPMTNILRVRYDHHTGGTPRAGLDIITEEGAGVVERDGSTYRVTSGDLSATLETGAAWNLRFAGKGEHLTESGHKSVAWMQVAQDADVDHGPTALKRKATTSYIMTQLELGVGETVYGLGERFGPFVKNGQSVDMWNHDGGTSSEQAYKNVPFYMTNRGYGILVNSPGHVSFEVASEAVERAQFSVEGESLEYFLIYGPTPAEILERYTALTGRPATVPAWSYGPWLSTSFTTDYDEATVNSFIDGMLERDLPLSVFHFDTFWMRPFNWCDFEWDTEIFPDPKGMLSRLHEKGLRVCVWINPYIAQESPLFSEGKQHGYLVTRPDGSVWQWDRWQAGMGLVDFTNPAAVSWFQEKLRRLLRQGVDCFKTDFGERIPVAVEYHDGTDPKDMHNHYAHLYNKAVYEVLVDERGEGEGVVFARAAAAGGQQFPVHWGGDSTSSFVSMAETLRGGLSLALSGFAYWSHDIGGFEGTPNAAVFKRWIAFGFLSSHSRFHGSDSYRVPWLIDEDESDAQSAVSITRTFSRLKNRLVPYLLAAGRQARATGTPIMRPMLLEFPEDPTSAYLDRQYMLGSDLLVAPVFTEKGDVEFYLPEGRWIGLLDGRDIEGGRWVREQHGFDSLPVFVRAGSVVPLGAREDRPDSDHVDGVTLVIHAEVDEAWSRTVEVEALDGTLVGFSARREGSEIVVESESKTPWNAQLVGGELQGASDGQVRLMDSQRLNA